MFNLSSLPIYRSGSNPQQNGSIPCLVELRNIKKFYQSSAGQFTALKKIDLKIYAGEFVAIVGKSGSGKSTLINMITGIDRPSSGECYVAGVALQSLNEEQIAVWRGQAIGIIFQFFQLLPTLTAVENILLAMDYGNFYPMAERPERAMSLLEKVHMQDYAHRLPTELSGGQQQIIAIARAMANNPPVIVADEPTGNLDSKSTTMVLDLFKELSNDGKTILMVTHDNDLAAQTRRILTISDGQIIGDLSNGAAFMGKEVKYDSIQVN